MSSSTRSESHFVARRFHALGDEIRLGILGMLCGRERCVCELTAGLAMAQSRLSFHLKVLKDAGLITQRRAGRWSYYAIDAEAFRDVEDYLHRVPSAAVSACCPDVECGAARAPEEPRPKSRKELR